MMERSDPTILGILGNLVHFRHYGVLGLPYANRQQATLGK